MKVSALWLLLVAAAATLADGVAAEAAADARAALNGAEALAELHRFVDAALAEQEETQANPSARRLLAMSEFEDHAVRYLSQMAVEADDETEAKAIFKLYQRVYSDEVATWGDTAEEQYAYFYANIFPKLLAKAHEQATSGNGKSSSGTTSSGTTGSGTTSSGTTGSGTTSSGTTGSGSTSSGTTESGSTSSGTTASGTTSSGTTGSGSTSSGTTASGTTSSGTSGSGTSTSSGSTSTTSALYTIQSSSSVVEVSSSLSFFSNVYDSSIATDILALQDNTNNIETVVATASGSSSSGGSSTGSSSSSGSATYTAPTILEGVGATTLDGRWRRLLGMSESSSSSAASVDILFCDVSGNAIWKWSAEDVPDVATTNTSSSTTTINVEVDGVCSSTTTTLTVSAYQSGCSLQNHPEGCGSVYYKGCGGMTVSPNSDKIVVARTGGRTLGVLSYVSVDGGSCQGQVVDAITTYRGRKFNSPTYAEFSNLGILYFTDSPFGLASSADDFDSDALDTSPLREIPFNGVYMLRNGSNQSVELVDCEMDRPNKIAFSPLQDKMYITNSRASNSYVKEYTLAEDGSVNGSSIFFNFTATPELDTDGGYATGIKTDDSGNVYVVVGKMVFIFTPNATLAGSIVSNQALDSVALGVGRMFITGGFGVVAQSSGVEPSQPIASAQTTCEAR